MQLSGGFVRLAEATVQRGEHAIHLRPKERALLAYLSSRAGETVSREELLQEVWGYRPGVISRTVDSTIQSLRRKVERDPRAPRHLCTVHGEGYRFVAPPSVGGTARFGHWVGRDQALDALRRWWRLGRGVMCVHGAPGIGKSRLVAEQLSREGAPALVFAPGRADVWPEPPLPLAELESTLAGDPLPDAIALDGLDGDRVDQARALRLCQTHAQRTRWLLTARAPPALDGAHYHRLGRLPPREGLTLLRQLLSGRPGQRRWGQELHELVACTDGQPAALYALARRLRHSTPAAELGRLRAPGSSTLWPELSGSLEASWADLPSWGVQVLAQCAIFRDPFTLQAASRWLVRPPGAPPLSQCLAMVADHGLLERLPGAPLRYLMLAVIRCSARERLADLATKRGPT